jgi:hypothetical protein
MARLLVLLLVVTTAFPTLAQSARPDAEILDVPSRTPSDTQFLQAPLRTQQWSRCERS